MRSEASAAQKFLMYLVSFALASLLLYCSNTDSASASEPPPILITEIMYDPEGSDSGNEWLELKNISTEAIDLELWSIQIAGNSFITKTYFKPFIIYPGQIILVGEKNLSGLDILVSSLSLQNGGSETDGVRLLNRNGVVVDTVLYDSPNLNELRNEDGIIVTDTAPDVASGNSLARIGDNDTNNSALDFFETSTPTPGEENLFAPIPDIQFPEEVSIDEEITFDASGSIDLDGEIISFTWTIEPPSGPIQSDTGPQITITFTETGPHIITLTITDDSGITQTETRDIEVAQNVEHPKIETVRNVLTLPSGEYVTIEATITAAPGTIFESEAYAQDPTGGIRLKVPSTIDLTGDTTYTISGKLGTTYGEPRITVDDAQPSHTTHPITAKQISPDGISLENRGLLVKTSFAPDSKRDRYFYGNEREDGTRPILYVPKMIDIQIPSTSDISSIEVTGIISQYGTYSDGTAKLRVMPISAENITFIGSEGVLATTGTGILTTLLTMSLISIVTLIFSRRYS